jgi:hypothetical protein
MPAGMELDTGVTGRSPRCGSVLAPLRSQNRHTGAAQLWYARALVATGSASKASAIAKQAADILATGDLPPNRALLLEAQHELPAGQRQRAVLPASAANSH